MPEDYESRQKKRKKSHNGAIALVITMMVLIAASVALLFLPEKSRPHDKNLTPTAAAVPTAGQEQPEEMLGVVLSVDTQIKTVTVYDVEAEEERTFIYTGVSVFKSPYGTQLTADGLKAEELVSITYEPSEKRILTAQGAKDVWEMKNVGQVLVYTDEHRMVVRGQNYRYSDGICVMNDGKRVELSALLPMDKVTVRGVGSKIVELMVTKGHGYIALINHEDFIGGVMRVGSGQEYTITQGGKYLLREGTYSVTIECGAYRGTEQVTIARDKTTEFDAYPYGRGPIQTGVLSFTIEPFGAVLYLNGKKTAYYGQDLVLEYGFYDIEVTEGGYVSYRGTVQVDSPEKKKLTIYLQENAPAVVENPSGAGSGNGSPGGTGNGSGGNGTGGTTGDGSGGNSTGSNTGDGAGGSGAGNGSNWNGGTGTGSGTAGDGTGSSAGGNDWNETGSGGAAMPTPTPVPQTTVSIALLGRYELNLRNVIYILGPVGATIYLDGDYIGMAPIDFEKIIGSYIVTVVKEDGEVKNFNCTEIDSGEDSYYNFSW